MAKKDTTKSQAEIYREERKQRIAKANKKNAKSIEKGKAVAGVGRKIVAIVLVVAIVVGAGYYIGKTTGIAHRVATAVKVGDIKVDAVDYNYYYYNMYNQMSYYAQMYAQYGMDSGFSTDVAPDEQTTTDEDGNEITWAEYFRTAAIDRAQFIEAYYAEAVKAGYELDEDAESEIQETIDSYTDNASESGYSLSAYLKASFGAGFSEKRFKTQLEKEEIATGYYNQKQEDLADEVSMDDIKAEYKENTKNYNYADVCYYVFSGTALTAEDGESDEDLAARQEKENKSFFADIKAIAEKVTDADSLEAQVKAYKASETEDGEADEDTTYCTTSKHTSYETISSALSSDVADWVYGAKTGAVRYFENGNDAYIVVVEKASYTGNSVSVRQILVSFDAEDEDNVTDEEKEAAYEEAESILNEWKKGDATEDSFADLVADNSDDTGSTDNGGLYENIRITDSYVDSFLDWSFDSSRKAGDTGIIESTYGYHIMYFVSNNTDDLDWVAAIREDMGNTAFTEYDEALLAEDGEYAVTSSDFWTNHISDEFCKKMAKNIAYNSSST